MGYVWESGWNDLIRIVSPCGLASLLCNSGSSGDGTLPAIYCPMLEILSALTDPSIPKVASLDMDAIGSRYPDAVQVLVVVAGCARLELWDVEGVEPVLLAESFLS